MINATFCCPHAFAMLPLVLRTIACLSLLLSIPVSAGTVQPHHPGILNVTAEPFRIDNTGTSDVTKQLQAAIDAAYDAQIALFLPPGRYLHARTTSPPQKQHNNHLDMASGRSRER